MRKRNYQLKKTIVINAIHNTLAKTQYSREQLDGINLIYQDPTNTHMPSDYYALYRRIKTKLCGNLKCDCTENIFGIVDTAYEFRSRQTN